MLVNLFIYIFKEFVILVRNIEKQLCISVNLCMHGMGNVSNVDMHIYRQQRVVGCCVNLLNIKILHRNFAMHNYRQLARLIWPPSSATELAFYWDHICYNLL